ncbi:hypothetical protein GNF80_02290 [Clostridium perfringens]|nr:hypothetical protein [Clostridium perfringens]
MNKGNFKKTRYLLNLQISRDLKITLSTAIGIMLLNVVYFVYRLSDDLEFYIEKTNNIPAVQMFDKFNSFSSFYSTGIASRMLVILIVGCFCLYCWYLWLGEFKGENKSSYTLLTLPIPKKFIIIYKFLSACFFYLSLVFFQIMAMFLNYFIFNVMVPVDSIVKESFLSVIINSISELYCLVPTDLVNLVTHSLFFVGLILIAFLFAILERSFGIKGGILGFLIGCSFIFMILMFPGIMEFYVFEKIIWFILISILYILIGWFFSKYLLEKKIHV